jgi:DNA-binding response OmpR family regulator
VLVLEDNATIGGISVALLREEGYRALRAWDLREAVKIARDRRPDAILLDLSLPYPAGVPVLHDLKAQPETRDAPVMLASANVLHLEPGEAELLVERVSRPVDIDHFINAVRRILGDPEHEVAPKSYSSTDDAHLNAW